MKVAVVGLGAVGAQALWQLSTYPGVEVHGFDAHYPGHSAAGAGGETRLYWSVELTEPRYLPIVRRAAELWDTLEQDSERKLRDTTGVLVIGKEGSAQLDTAVRSAESPIERLSHDDLKGRFPQFQFSPEDAGIWDTSGGVIWPELTVSAAAQTAARRGAQIHEFDPVRSIDILPNGVRIEARDLHDFDRVIVACGGWTPTLLPYLKNSVVARRLTSTWYFGRNAGYLDALPPFMQTAPNYCYGIPGRDGRSVKLGLGFNDHLVTGNPNELEREVSGRELDDEIQKFDWIRDQLLPGLSPRPYRVSTFVESYTRSMLEHLEFHPESNNVLVLTGFSGHGFRVAPAMGEIGAQMLIEGESRVATGFLQEAPPVFDVLNQDTGETTHNPVMSSTGSLD